MKHKCKACEKRRRQALWLRCLRLKSIEQEVSRFWSQDIHYILWHVNGNTPRTQFDKESYKYWINLISKERANNPPGLQIPLP